MVKKGSLFVLNNMDKFQSNAELRKRVLIKEMIESNIRLGILSAYEKKKRWSGKIPIKLIVSELLIQD